MYLHVFYIMALCCITYILCNTKKNVFNKNNTNIIVYRYVPIVILSKLQYYYYQIIRLIICIFIIFYILIIIISIIEIDSKQFRLIFK